MKTNKPDGAPSAARQNGARSAIVGFIGGYLIDQGTLTLEQLDTALLYQIRLAETGEHVPLEDALMRLRLADKGDIASAKARQQHDADRRSR